MAAMCTMCAAAACWSWFIVRETLRHYGGDIQVTSDAQETVFSGTVPKDTTIPEAKAAQENSTNA